MSRPRRQRDADEGEMGAVKEEARSLIRAYIDHLADAEYARSIFALADVQTISDLLAEMVRSGSGAEANDALFFVRDVVNYRLLPAFTESLPSCGLFTVLREGVYSGNWEIRRGSIYTLGKIAFPENAPILVEAFPRYVERDPLLLPDLIVELLLLTGGARRWEYLEEAASSPVYLSRWAALDEAGRHVGDNQPEKPDVQRLERFFATLADDTHPFVRTEAAYRLAELRLGWESRQTGRGERRRRYRTLRQTEPDLTFISVANLFSQYLYLESQIDYSIELMDAFAQYCRARPFAQDVGLHAYCGAFATSRQGGF